MKNQQKHRYESPLVARNASPAMAALFSQHHRILTWRRVWLALAEAQKELGLPITSKQLAELRRGLENIDLAKAARYEQKTRHDVMAHLHAYGDVAPAARGILHMGATSCDITDNADLVILREAMELIRDWLVNVIDAMGKFARRYRNLPTLGLTHYQPAQLTTVGKRAANWCYDFVRDLEEVEARIAGLRFRGVRGATGTQASFLQLLDGSASKVDRLEKLVARKMGFSACEPVTGQTYSRKVDAQTVNTLAQIATSVHKFCNDIRLLAGAKEIEEPFETTQVGSSAMAYKRNPMRCERATGLARLVISLTTSPMQTAAEQWLERSLDDSSNRRVAVAEAFLATDGMLMIVANVARGLVVYPKVIAARVAAELPFMATEAILMAATAAGGDRQALHERIRTHSHAAAKQVKHHGRANDLLARIKSDPAFEAVDIDAVVQASNFVGLAPRQVDRFLADVVTPIRRRYRKAIGKDASLHV